MSVVYALHSDDLAGSFYREKVPENTGGLCWERELYLC